MPFLSLSNLWSPSDQYIQVKWARRRGLDADKRPCISCNVFFYESFLLSPFIQLRCLWSSTCLMKLRSPWTMLGLQSRKSSGNTYTTWARILQVLSEMSRKLPENLGFFEIGIKTQRDVNDKFSLLSSWRCTDVLWRANILQILLFKWNPLHSRHSLWSCRDPPGSLWCRIISN